MTNSLENLTISPDAGGAETHANDLLSHVLAQIRLTGDQAYSCRLQPAERLPLEAAAGHLLILTHGTILMENDGHPATALETGDLLLLTRGPGSLVLAAASEGASAVACRFWFDRDGLRGMVGALPQAIHIRREEGAEWIESIASFVKLEADDVQPGAALMISRLIDLIVIRALRTWVHLGRSTGWLGGLSDVRIARALQAIHEKPMESWTIATLADIAGMSRSSFSERFTILVGRSPLRYYNDVRLSLARDLLQNEHARVGEVGLSIGYESEAAFSRAYKAQFGHSPRETAKR